MVKIDIEIDLQATKFWIKWRNSVLQTTPALCSFSFFLKFFECYPCFIPSKSAPLTSPSFSHATFHFHMPGRTLPIGTETKAEPGNPTLVWVVGGSSGNHAVISSICRIQAGRALVWRGLELEWKVHYLNCSVNYQKALEVPFCFQSGIGQVDLFSFVFSGLLFSPLQIYPSLAVFTGARATISAFIFLLVL